MLIRNLFKVFFIGSLFLTSAIHCTEKKISFEEAQIALSGNMSFAYDEIFESLTRDWIFSDEDKARECLPGAIRNLDSHQPRSLALLVHDYFRLLWAEGIRVATPPYRQPLIVLLNCNDHLLENQEDFSEQMILSGHMKLHHPIWDRADRDEYEHQPLQFLARYQSDYFVMIREPQDENALWQIQIYDPIAAERVVFYESIENLNACLRKYILETEALNPNPEWQPIQLKRKRIHSTAELYEKLCRQAEVIVCVPEHLDEDVASFKILTHWSQQELHRVSEMLAPSKDSLSILLEAETRSLI